ncbi:hypothetical protein HBH70_112440 [Parastagonospora nodorum]|nr:hypothetical protein HBH51_146670 [Parastagonospora nodorum]KAH3973858.1 hypothetical protein HBH52_136710 [Parastagonospora nodorum]KAH4034049.1 hypothetical protein HBI09_116130 [Parastagonospora nodorum]KAH4062053.1 hypothetical protein HBH50_213720 [Parastagonospora nodorum]KAH4088651.1 hypothetical protein HBH48_117250 [Parastagonospora nodorum]
MSQESRALAVKHSPFPQIIEVVEQVLLCLDHTCITRATAVCSFWKNCVANSQPLLRKTLKLPYHPSKDPNPNFHDLIEESKNAVIPYGKFRGDNLWQRVREFEDNWIDDMHKMTAEERGEQLELESTLNTNYCWRMKNIRDGFQGVRFPDGWPIGLRELHCDLCEKWHADFRHENLHPLLQFLDDMNVCFRGYGTQLLFCFHPLDSERSGTAPESCWKHAGEEAVCFAQHLQKAHKAVEIGSVAKDLWLRYPATKLVLGNKVIVENANGLTLDQVVPFLSTIFRFIIIALRNRCHTFKVKKPKVRDESIENMIANYPTREDWDKHMDSFSTTLTDDWETALRKVDSIMVDVAIWEPVMEKEIELEDWDYWNM